MNRFVSILLAMISAASVPARSGAQEAVPEPHVTVELSADETIVGQPLVLRLKVLVPTWMPKPPVFPNIEVPQVMVRLPERASGPVSERVDGETWSGVQRAYRIYPLAAGGFALPPGDVTVTYAVPGQNEPKTHVTQIPEVSFRATVPAGARGLDPLIIAEAFTVDQQLQGLPETGQEIPAGEAVTRIVTAAISGTTAVMIPQLTPDLPDDGTGQGALRAYPKDPTIHETENRGDLSGQRIEEITYVAQRNGAVTLPAISVDWFNLDTGKVETARLPEIDLTVTGAETLPGLPRDPVDLFRLLLAGVGAAGLVWAVWHWGGPVLRGRITVWRAQWLGSERFASRRVVRAIRTRNLAGVMVGLGQWRLFFPQATQADLTDLDRALTAVGRAEFGPASGAPPDWAELARQFRATRGRLRRIARAGRTRRALPPLNP